MTAKWKTILLSYMAIFMLHDDAAMRLALRKSSCHNPKK